MKEENDKSHHYIYIYSINSLSMSTPYYYIYYLLLIHPDWSEHFGSLHLCHFGVHLDST